MFVISVKICSAPSMSRFHLTWTISPPYHSIFEWLMSLMLLMTLKMTILVVYSRKKEVIMGDRPAIEWGMKGGSVINSPRTLIASSALNPKTFWVSIYS